MCSFKYVFFIAKVTFIHFGTSQCVKIYKSNFPTNTPADCHVHVSITFRTKYVILYATHCGFH